MARVQPLGPPMVAMRRPDAGGLAFLNAADRRPAFNVRAYQRFVTAMKVVLGASAILLVALVLAWPDLAGRDTPGPVDNPLPGGSSAGTEADVAERASFSVDKARYCGGDALGRQFDITADGAHNIPDSPRRINLDKPKAKLVMENERALNLHASQGRLDGDGKLLTLGGGVTVSHSDGYRVTTQDAAVDLDKGTARGDQAVVGSGKFGRLEAQGFQIQDKGDLVHLSGSSRLLLTPSRKEK